VEQSLPNTTSTRNGPRKQGKLTLGSRLFPNPATNQLTVAWEEEVRSIAVYDAQGKLMVSLDGLSAGQRQHQLNVEAWAGGLYTVQLIGDEVRHTQRFAKR